MRALTTAKEMKNIKTKKQEFYSLFDDLKINYKKEFPNIEMKDNFLAFIPMFGSAKGMLVELIIDSNLSDKELSSYCKLNGMFYSGFYIDENHTVIKDRIIDAFVDWGYFGNKRDLYPWLSI